MTFQRRRSASVACWAHARRRFMDVIKAQGKNRKKTGSADIALGYIRRLYEIENDAGKRGLSPEKVYEMRQERAKSILEKFREWLLKKSIQTPPKELLGKAVLYTLKQWDRLVGYLEDGRKKWLFSGPPEGAEASALLYSLIETAKANGLESYGISGTSLKNCPLPKPWRTTKPSCHGIVPGHFFRLPARVGLTHL